MKNQNLNGLWDFSMIPDHNTVPVYDSVMTVPGCFDVRPGQFGKREIGCYRRKVSVSGGKAMLSIGGCGLHAEFFWDGVSIGKSVLPYTPEEFLFDAGAEGEHTLTAITDNFITDNPGEMFKLYYDFYGFGGIYGDVSITEFAPADIRKVDVIPLDDKTGTVKIHVIPFETAPETLKISFDGIFFKEIPFAKELTCDVPEFKLWSPDSPNLHTVSINGTSVTFGIRVLEWKGQQLKLNGKPLKLMGCNRHESHPQFGAATPKNLILNDLLMIKQQGFNFIRGSHYAQKEIMLEICDRLGLMVWDEALGWGNRPEHFTDKTFAENQETQCRKMVQNSINHPSVIIWGFLNECFSFEETAPAMVSRLYSAIRELDQSRPITYASTYPEKDICFDLVDIIAVNNYPGWYDAPDYPVDGTDRVRPMLEKFAEQFKDVPKPLIMSEIGASAIYGDHSGFRWSEEYQADVLEEVVKAIFEIKRYTGAAIWMFCDANSHLESSLSFQRPRGFNNKGMLNEFRKPKISWKRVNALMKKQSIENKSNNNQQERN